MKLGGLGVLRRLLFGSLRPFGNMLMTAHSKLTARYGTPDVSPLTQCNELSGIELMIDDNVEDELILMDFHSIQDLKGWLDTTTLQPPQPRNSSGPRMG